MKRYFENLDVFAVKYTETIIKNRYLIILASIIFAIAIGSGGRFLDFSTDYRDFFSDSNPELQAFEDLQKTYTKNDNILFVLEPQDREVFSQKTLSAVEWLTEQSWQIPYAQRVDSLSNFQHTYGYEDDLVVEDLAANANQLNSQQLKNISTIALKEPLIRKQLVNENGSATAVLVTLNYPQKDLKEVPDSVNKARELRTKLMEKFPSIEVNMSGVSVLNNAFSEAGFGDMQTLVPLMFAVIILLTLIIIRSLTGTLATFLVIAFSSMVGMGAAGFYGVKLTPIAGQAPTIILTLAIADSIHILISLRTLMRDGMAKNNAIKEAVRLNFLPVTITSLTTIIGFLALNFSDSPPFWHLGNITALGILSAWFFSLTLLPALISVLPFKVKTADTSQYTLMDRLGDFVIARPLTLIMTLGIGVLILIAFIPKIELNDQWSQYFDESIEFRKHTDQVVKNFGIYPIEFSLPAPGPGRISDPDYLHNMEKFANYLREQKNVKHVYAFSEIIKRLNKNLHGDNTDYYKIPDDNELAAQYLLLYEMSLPMGLDLNDRINIDKSATRVTATLDNTSTAETKIFLNNTKQWIKENLPDYMQSTVPTSAQVMFTYIAERNVNNMIGGTIGAIILISLILMISLMSWKLGLLSLIPNGLPILATFGAWALLIGQVGFSVAAVASISLGIIVDDTVHFLSKYARARKEKNFTSAESVKYAFHNVGVAILVNTIILAIGFLVLTTSTFKVNFDMGMLTAIAIVFALILDFLLLPALLIFFDRQKPNDNSEASTMKKTHPATAILIIALLTAAPLTAQETAIRGDTDAEKKGFEVSARSDRSDRGFGNSEVKGKMILRNAAGQESSRSMTFITLEVADESVGDKSLVIFNTPKDVEGTALLSHAKILKQDDQWLYLPALKRVKRISSKNKSGPFVGSEFAFEDFTSTELNKYDYEWLREETCGEFTCDVVKRIPRYAHSGYTKQLAWIDQQDFQLRKVEFYNRQDSLLKTLTVNDYKKYDDIWRFHKLSMNNHKTGKSTDLIYEDYQFNVGLNDNDFVKGRLSQLK